jgi:hypothetical protein
MEHKKIKRLLKETRGGTRQWSGAKPKYNETHENHQLLRI